MDLVVFLADLCARHKRGELVWVSCLEDKRGVMQFDLAWVELS